MTVSHIVCVAPCPMNKDTVTIHLNTGGIINNETTVYGQIILETVGSPDACTLSVEMIVSNGGVLLTNIDTVSTGVISLVVANNGQFGLGGAGGQRCVRMDYFCTGDCDTVDSIPGNTEYYLYDGSIIVGGIVNGDTILSNQIYSQGFGQESSIYPLTPPTPPTVNGVVQYWRSGILTNHDTTIGMEISYCAPQITAQWGTQAGKTWHADQQFITREFKVWSMDGQPHEGIVAGEVIDWDIPSDSGVSNDVGIDAIRRVLYSSGGDYFLDSEFECQSNSSRYGGMAFGYFKHYNSALKKWSIVDSLGYGGYHAKNSDFAGWDDNELYAKMGSSLGYVPIPQHPPPEPPTDYHSVLTYKFDQDLSYNDLLPNDSFCFYAVLATVRGDLSGPARILQLADRGRNFTHYFGCCRDKRGDLDGNGADCNILDLNFQVNSLFRSGTKPTCLGEADVNSDGSPGDILDLNFMVNRIFREGAEPRSCGTPPTN